jgi:drug/metabolite transporter (DMT)-like permease
VDRSRSTLIAFAGIVLFGGLNAVSVKFAGKELQPFWSAALRLVIASAVLFALVGVRRVPLPRGKALVGSVLYGILGFGSFLALIYWGLLETPAGLAMVVLALVPLLTLLLAVVHGLERFRLVSLGGALIALAGIAVVFWEHIGGAHPAALASIVAIGTAAVATAETNVVVKLFPRPHPLANNAVAMGVGAVMLLVISLFAGENWALPQQPQTIVAVAYLALFGSVALFMLFLFVIERWTASSTSYALLLMPLVAAVAAALLLGEAITPALLVGGALVLVGVYLGAFGASLSRPLPGLFHRPRPAVAGAAAGGTVITAEGPPTLISPNCP